MNDKADIGFINAHAKGDGGNHHHIFRRDKGRLIGAAHLWRKPGMIGPHGPTRHRKGRRQFFRRIAGSGIDNPRPGRCPNKIDDLSSAAIARRNGITDIGPVKARDDHTGHRNAQLGQYVTARMRIGRGRQRQTRHLRKGIH